MLTKSPVPYSYDLYIGIPISRLLTELREPSFEALVHRGRVFTCPATLGIYSFHWNSVLPRTLRRIKWLCLYSAVNMHNDSCEPGSQIQGRMMFYSKCWECGSWSLLGTICSWWLTIMGKWFYCFHIRQEKWYLCMSPKKGCCWASSSSLVMYLATDDPCLCTILDPLWRNLVPLLLLYMEWFFNSARLYER